MPPFADAISADLANRGAIMFFFIGRDCLRHCACEKPAQACNRCNEDPVV
jgi:hypothetical protein